MLLGEGGGCLGSGCGRVEAVSNAEGWGRKLRGLRKLTDLRVGWDFYLFSCYTVGSGSGGSSTSKFLLCTHKTAL